ncbi:MFS transporter [Georgenia sp. TF02-10]|uniref:MFS transporter n=1 Tax=Georgenia sp. TF02-10 TaxID=2917725 RepID=UPI001FA6B5C4|nr:MFS transporter [Georgenia sp. TF02-10]UNX55527.1 MFS transporter [Georgenia sp. TF02-10]
MPVPGPPHSSRDGAGRSPRRPWSSGFLLLGIVLVAVNLRPVITALGPVLPLVGAETGLSPAALGLLGAMPVVAFAVVSPVVHLLIDRLGVERTVLGALVVLTVATVLRSWPGPAANLWVGTVLIGATVAVGNVAMPVVVKQDFPSVVARTTGVYVAALSVCAALASGLAVPLAGLSTLGWRLSLGVWALLTVVAVAAWVPRALRPGPGRPGPLTGRPAPGRPPSPAAGRPPSPSPPRPAGPSVWRSGLAWQLAGYMGLQSTAFYVLVTWLPTLEQDLGISPADAGWYVSFFQVVGIAGNLGAPAVMRLGRDQRLAAALPGLLLAVAVVGMLVAPGLVLLWSAGIGLSTGAAFVISLSLMSLRAADAATAGRLSGMSQAVGYALAALGLVLAGVVRDLTGPGPWLLVLVGLVAVAMVILGLRVGTSRPGLGGRLPQ